MDVASGSVRDSHPFVGFSDSLVQNKLAGTNCVLCFSQCVQLKQYSDKQLCLMKCLNIVLFNVDLFGH